ncbi:recombinase family protein [Neomicrococcus lactis]
MVYLRISQDRTGQQAGIQRQQEDYLAMGAPLGATDSLVFIDNDVCAFDGGRCPGYDAMVTEVRAGAFRVVVGHVDRLQLQPRELEDLINLVAQYPLWIEAVRGGGFDLNTTESRLMARQLVAIRAVSDDSPTDGIRSESLIDATRPIDRTETDGQSR